MRLTPWIRHKRTNPYEKVDMKDARTCERKAQSHDQESNIVNPMKDPQVHAKCLDEKKKTMMLEHLVGAKL